MVLSFSLYFIVTKVSNKAFRHTRDYFNVPYPMAYVIKYIFYLFICIFIYLHKTVINFA